MKKGNITLLIAWLIALSALVITLYGSEIVSLPVCHLCWYQRICMYPLAIILGIATWRNDIDIKIYTLPLSILGALFALYQYLEQMIPGFAPIHLCGGDIDCSIIHFQWFGFITYPFLSFIAFILISLCLLMTKKGH